MDNQSVMLLDQTLSLAFQFEQNPDLSNSKTTLREISDYLHEQWILFWYSDQMGQNNHLTPRCSKISEVDQVWHLLSHQIWLIRKYYLVDSIILNTALEESLPFQLTLLFLKMNSEEKNRIVSWIGKVDPWYKINQRSLDNLEKIKCLLLDNTEEKWPGIYVRIWLINALSELERSHISGLIFCQENVETHNEKEKEKDPKEFDMTDQILMIKSSSKVPEYYHTLSSAWLRESWIKLVLNDKNITSYLPILIRSDWMEPLEQLIKLKSFPIRTLIEQSIRRIFELVQFPIYQRKLFNKYVHLWKQSNRLTGADQQEIKEKLSIFFSAEVLNQLDLDLIPQWATDLLEPKISETTNQVVSTQTKEERSNQINEQNLMHLAYLLNLPIDGASYTKVYLYQRVKTLMSNLPVNVKSYQKQNEQYWRNWAEQLQVIIVNHRNLSEEKICKYPIAEVAYLIIDRQVYFFTRTDFAWIFKENLNPWNRVKLTDRQINRLKVFQRNIQIPEYNLTLKHLYKHLEQSEKKINPAT